MEQRFANLRGVRWRINLGILPSSAPIDDLRRVTADSRRRYAILRRCLLVDPHLPKDENGSRGLIMDNPLSQNPDSTWGRFFQNAELEKMLDQDLSRLYPEHGTYFQMPVCQAMLRRILLLWCLRHPEYGYRQGMHELLAPLLYVLHIDIQHLCEVRSLYEDYFNDDFDTVLYLEGDLVSNYRFTKAKNLVRGTKEASEFDGSAAKIMDDVDPETKDVFLLTDAYGAEGELGIVLSERFLEHDAYCMFDNLMKGAHGVVAMADFFSLSPGYGSSSGLSPVLEASSSLYHLLAIVDPYLHSHLVELSVEPQYFALRWLRVLFGREFSLKDLLIIWDEIFSYPNGKVIADDSEYKFRVLCSPRGAFISALAVSMLLHLRSSLLSTEHTTICLQRLLSFPENLNVKKLIEKAKSLQELALKSNISSAEIHGDFYRNKTTIKRGHSLSSDSVSLKTPLSQTNESFWEEKWRMMNNEATDKGNNLSGSSLNRLGKTAVVDSFGLSRAESDPLKVESGKKSSRPPVRRSLLDDMNREVDSDVNNRIESAGSQNVLVGGASVFLKLDMEKNQAKDSDQNITVRTSDCTTHCSTSGDNSSLSVVTSPQRIDNGGDNDLEKSSMTSNSSLADNDEERDCMEENSHSASSKEDDTLFKTQANPLDTEKNSEVSKERKPLFQWFRNFGRVSGEGSSGKCSVIVDANKNASSSLSSNACGVHPKKEAGDGKVMDTLKSLKQSMLDNIQVIESVFQQDWSQSGSLDFSKNILGSKGQAKAIAALKELRKISNLLTEM